MRLSRLLGTLRDAKVGISVVGAVLLVFGGLGVATAAGESRETLLPLISIGVALGFGVLAQALSTERGRLRQCEQQLFKSQHHFARSQELAEIGSFEGDLSKNKVVWSDNLYSILGVDKNSFVITMDNFLALVHPEDRAGFKARYYPVMTDRADGPFEYRTIRPDGEWRYLVRESERIRDAQGTVIGVIGTVRDVTKAKRAEQARLELERQLHHAQRVEAIGRLAGGIAHDLNNTMVPVVALSKMLMKKHSDNHSDRKHLAMIHRAGLHAQELVNQILAFSRNETPQRQLLNLIDLVSDALAMMRATLPSTIRIVCRVEERLPPVVGDPTQLHQMIVNLVTNAAQAIGTAMGEIAIHLATDTELGSAAVNRELLLSIRDTGCGMSKTTMDRIFEPFFTTKGVGEGSGLGLAVVHGIVGSHGGRIEVTSEVGEGARFDVFLPVAEGQAKSAP